jgi:hypothetical protein
MAEYVQWDSIPNTSSNGEKSDFLRLESGKNYKIRPIFEPVKFFKYFHKHDGKLRTAICAKPDTCPARDKHPELKKPSLRFAAYVIDRADGKVKILEAPQTVFRPIGASLEMTGKNPGGGKDGSDWYIKVTGKGLNTNYDVGFIDHTPLTAEERDTIKEALDGDKLKLQKLYKIDTPEEIEEKLFGDWDKKDSSAIAVADSPEIDEGSEELSNPATASIKNDFDNNW